MTTPAPRRLGCATISRTASRRSARLAPALFLRAAVLLSTAISATVFTAGCGKAKIAEAVAVAPEKHEHVPPHGGTAVVLGDEAYHLELVLNWEEGKLQAFVLDGEMEEFIRCAAPSFEVIATVGGAKLPLLFAATADPATGENPGDTALFEAKADWLKTTRAFDAVLTSLTIRGTTFAAVSFNFPRGNDADDHAPTGAK